jgi:transcriptional regulator with XRE-family HTH domain
MIGKQLRELLREEKIKVEKFAEFVEINPRTIYAYTSDQNDPKYELLLQIKKKYREKTGKNINLDYLISGEGDMFITKQGAEAPYVSEEEVKRIFNELLAEKGIK